jgi:hypothetical protein
MRGENTMAGKWKNIAKFSTRVGEIEIKRIGVHKYSFAWIVMLHNEIKANGFPAPRSARARRPNIGPGIATTAANSSRTGTSSR